MKERIKTVRSSSLPPHCKFYLRIKFKLRPKWVLLSLLCCTEDDSFWQQGEWLPSGLKTEFQIPLCKINSKKSAYTTDTFMDCCAMCLLSTLLPVNSCCLKVRKNCLIWKVLVHWGFAILPETPRTTPVSHYSNKWLNFPSNSMSAKSSSTNKHLYLRTVKLRGNTELEGLKSFI